MEVIGNVKIKNGNKEIEVNNTIVENGINMLLDMLNLNEDRDYGGTDSWKMSLGDDTATSTSSDMTSLVSVISSSSDSSSGSLTSGTGDYRVTYTCTWNSGSVTGTLGECALHLNTDVVNGGVREMFSRLASADTDFSSFVIDDSKPLTIDWTIKFQFT